MLHPTQHTAQSHRGCVFQISAMLLRFKGDSGGKSRPNFELLVTVKFGECRRMSERVCPVTKRLIYFQRSAARPSRTSRESGVKKS